MIFDDKKEIIELVIAICGHDYEKLEELQENEFLEHFDLMDDIFLDSIKYSHRYTAEQYIERAVEQLKLIEEIEDENLKDKLKKIIYNIIPKTHFLSYEFNMQETKVVEDYFS